MLPKNVHATPLVVFHSELERYQEPYKSECPGDGCESGLLLVKRVEGHLQRIDRCTSCGQVVCYSDETIALEPLQPSLSEALAQLGVDVQ